MVEELCADEFESYVTNSIDRCSLSPECSSKRPKIVEGHDLCPAHTSMY